MPLRSVVRCVVLSLVLVMACRRGPVGTLGDPNGGAGTGAACSNPDGGQQSDCLSGLSCQPISEQNMCTYLNCRTDSECGSFEGQQNYCLTLPQVVNRVGCMRGCDPEADAGCGRDDFLCTTDSSSRSYCVPDCRTQGADYCDYGTLCDAISGECAAKKCSSQSVCPDGLICATVDERSICVTDCDASGCPDGRTCNSSGGCDSIVLGLNETCSLTLDLCDTSKGLACVQPGSGEAICMKQCTSDADCSAASGSQQAGSCLLSSGESFYCVVPCFNGYTTCPTGLTCQTASSGSSVTGTVCLP